MKTIHISRILFTSVLAIIVTGVFLPTPVTAAPRSGQRPVAASATSVYGGGYGVYAFDSLNGQLMWRSLQRVPMSGVASTAGAVFASEAGPRGGVYGLVASDGSTIWHRAIAEELTSPVVAEGLLYVASLNTKITTMYALRASDGTPVWTYTTDATTLSDPAVVRGVVYFTSGNAVYALDAKTGSKLWMTANAGTCTPAVAGDTVFTSTGYQTSSVFALDAATGAVKWSSHVGTNFSGVSSPAVAGEMVYAIAEVPGPGGQYTGKNRLFALDASTGREIWSHTTTGGHSAAPVAGSGTVYMGAGTNMLALNASTGVILWKRAPGGRYTDLSGRPRLMNGTLYALYFDRLCALRAGTGAMRWAFTMRSGVYRPGAVDKGVLYAGSLDHKLYALKAASGEKVWSVTTRSTVDMPAVGKGIVYVGAEYDRFYAVRASNGKVLWTALRGGSGFAPPVVRTGVVYVGLPGSIHAFKASTGAPIHTYKLNPGRLGEGPVLGFTVSAGVVYAASGPTISAFKNGKKIWSRTNKVKGGGGYDYTTPVVAGRRLYVGSGNGTVYAFKTSTGAQIWSRRTSPSDNHPAWSLLALSGSRVYASNTAGTLYALSASTGAKLWSYGVDGSTGVPSVVKGVAYVSTGRGQVLAIRATTGKKLWARIVDGPSDPVVGDNMVLIGSLNVNIYGLTSGTGKRIWSFATGQYPD